MSCCGLQITLTATYLRKCPSKEGWASNIGLFPKSFYEKLSYYWYFNKLLLFISLTGIFSGDFQECDMLTTFINILCYHEHFSVTNNFQKYFNKNVICHVMVVLWMTPHFLLDLFHFSLFVICDVINIFVYKFCTLYFTRIHPQK